MKSEFAWAWALDDTQLVLEGISSLFLCPCFMHTSKLASWELSFLRDQMIQATDWDKIHWFVRLCSHGVDDVLLDVPVILNSLLHSLWFPYLTLLSSENHNCEWLAVSAMWGIKLPNWLPVEASHVLHSNCINVIYLELFRLFVGIN